MGAEVGRPLTLHHVVPHLNETGKLWDVVWCTGRWKGLLKAPDCLSAGGESEVDVEVLKFQNHWPFLLPYA